jgi:hypothetical protein
VNVFVQTVKAHRGHGAISMFRHLGALGLFSLAILDSSPVPTFAGPDILTAILAASHRSPWYEYAAVATAGSVIGAYLTFRIARRVGSAYPTSKFGHRKLTGMLGFFRRWGNRGSCRLYGGTIPFTNQRVFRGGRRFAIQYPQISHGGNGMPKCALRIHRHHC